MEIKIVKLTPELLHDYLQFFETAAHTDNPEWDRCYCVNYCADHNADADFSTPELRREMAIRYVNSGKIKGYLAYCGGKVAGWCNANDRSACMGSSGWRFVTDDLTSPMPGNAGEKVKFIYCFTVAPDMRRKGIAKALLKRVCEDAAAEGYTCVEACPNREFTNIYYDYVGPIKLYKDFGFVPCGETKYRVVCRKYL